jgi:hypothetical protein
MSYYNLCGIGSQHSNISKGKKGGGGAGVHIKITGMPDEVTSLSESSHGEVGRLLGEINCD